MSDPGDRRRVPPRTAAARARQREGVPPGSRGSSGGAGTPAGSPTGTPTGAVIDCPRCGLRSAVGTDRCPRCGYPLVLVTPTTAGHTSIDPDLFVEPGEEPVDDEPGGATTAPVPVVEEPVGPAGQTWTTQPIAPSLPPGTGVRCRICGNPNSAARERWCEWCGAELRPAPAPLTSDTPLGPPLPRPWRRWLLGGLAAAVVVVGLPVAVALALTAFRDTPPDPSPSPAVTVTVGPTVEAAAVAIDPARISPEASSTFPDDGGRYDLANTLDGLDDTAWNSHGVVTPPPGIQLTYTFDTPVDLRAASVRNGYVRSDRNEADIYERNARLRNVVVGTDAGEAPATLLDVREEQPLAVPPGVTTRVVIEIVDVYPGTQYPDVALTDIRFEGIG